MELAIVISASIAAATYAVGFMHGRSLPKKPMPIKQTIHVAGEITPERLAWLRSRAIDRAYGVR